MRSIVTAMVALLALTGCSTVRAPSVEEHAAIVHLVRQRLAQDKMRITLGIPFKITIHGRHATAEYDSTYEPPETVQAAFNPMRTDFNFVSNQWAIVEHKSNRSWLSQWK